MQGEKKKRKQKPNPNPPWFFAMRWGELGGMRGSGDAPRGRGSERMAGRNGEGEAKGGWQRGGLRRVT